MCPVCKISSCFYKRFFIEGKEFIFLKCPECGLIFLKERHFEESFYNKYYKEVEDSKFSIDFFPQERGRGKRVYEIISSMKKSGRCLDIGCGPGFFLGNLKRYGNYELFGVEISEVPAKYAEKNFGIKVFCGDIKNADYPEKFFDIIILSHVLEHLPEPLETLEKIRNFLKEDGIFYCEVPDEFGSINGLIRTQLLKKPPIGLYAGHLNYFCRSSLKNILNKGGFKLIRRLWTHSHIDINRAISQIFGIKVELKKSRDILNPVINRMIFLFGLGFELRAFCKKS
jgi:SAM-dependent methyltransferase